MSRYRGPGCRQCRTYGEKLFLKTKKCYTAKCILERRNSKPGQHGKNKKKISDYGAQLAEKQKLKKIYGMTERPFRLYFEEASRQKGVTGTNLLILLERRLDNVLMRAGLAGSRCQARQFIRHGHIKVNQKRVDIPSFLVRQNDKIEVSQKEKIRKNVDGCAELAAGRPSPSWLKMNREKLEADIIRLPELTDMDQKVNVQSIVELYSK